MTITANAFRKKPVVIEAMQWTGGNAAELSAWTEGAFHELDPLDRDDSPVVTGALYVAANSAHLGVEQGEWVIRDARGFYPCKPDIFAATYDAVEASA